MRRLPLLLVLSLACAACTGGTEARPVSAAPAGMVPETEITAVRSSVLAFLRAYAAAERDVRPLGELVAGEELENWVYWLGIQNSGLRFGRPGSLRLRALRVVEINPDRAAAALDATVTLFVRGDGGRTVPTPRLFQGPVMLTRAGPAWAVADAYRDGRSMLAAITVLDPPVGGRAEGVEIFVESVFRFSQGTVVNLVLRNETGRTIRVDLENSAIAVSNMSLQGAGLTASLSRRIPPGAEVPGALNFPPMELQQVPAGMVVRVLRGRPLTVPIAFPQTPFLPQP